MLIHAKIGQTWEMNFRLEPWESSSTDKDNKAVSVEFGPVNWKGQNVMASARWRHLSWITWAFVRFHRSDINYVIVWKKRVYPIEKTDDEILERIARQAVAGEEFQLGRIFYLRSAHCLITPTEVFWIKQSATTREVTEFCLPDEVREGNSAYVFQWLQQQWQQLDSEVRFAWEWNRKNIQQQQQYFFETLPRWRELSELMTAVASAIQIPSEQIWTLNHVDSSAQFSEVQEQLENWSTLFVAHFLPFAPLPLSEPKCLRDSLQFAADHIHVKGTETSAHQQLEAKLFLRDWLIRNASDHLHLIQ